MTRLGRLCLALVVSGMCAGLGGCSSSSSLARLIVETPNHGRTITDDQQLSATSQRWLGVDRVMRVPVGPPEATIAVWIVEPPDDVPPRGTILVLHGFDDGPFWMLGKAKRLARHGYRAAVVAHRGYADSSGDYRTFGVVEKQDLSQVIDALEREQLVSGELGVWGMSYGAAMALELAGHDPRVKAVVSVSAFSSMRSVVPNYARRLKPARSAWLTDEQIQHVIDVAGEQADFDPDRASAADAVEQTGAPILLMHGTWDAIVPYEHAQRLYAHAGPDAQLVPIPAAGHISIWFDMDGQVARRTNEWFDRWLQ